MPPERENVAAMGVRAMTAEERLGRAQWEYIVAIGAWKRKPCRATVTAWRVARRYFVAARTAFASFNEIARPGGSATP